MSRSSARRLNKRKGLLMDVNLRPRYPCVHCNVNTRTPLLLDQHVLSKKHRKTLKRAFPAEVPLLPSLQYFLDTYLKDEPLIGLEYITEEQGDIRKYMCRLCDVYGPRTFIVGHICSIYHKKNYMLRHHPEEAATVTKFAGESIFFKVLHVTLVEILSKHGKKRIQEGPIRRRFMQRWNKRKWCDVQPSVSDEGEAEATDSWKIRESRDAALLQISNIRDVSQQFIQNDEFYDYLRKVEIENYSDANFVHEIVKNCISKVMSFQGTQTSKQAEEKRGSPSSSHPTPAYADGADGECVSQRPVPPGRLVPSGSQCKDVSSLVSEADDESDAAEICFNSPVKMEASDLAARLREVRQQLLHVEGLMPQSHEISYLNTHDA